ncbi:hypothetical protein [Robertmurraya korlensis]|uniref:hypothetical protein n=1 Tax=Robertmurraya korlensis TaxID=519977 RepID=UPI000825F99C|nr:hypothetical protein [Robertmurraya korlensis]
MSKKRAEAIIQVMLDTFKHLSEEQVDKLLTGSASLQYKDISPQSHPYEDIKEDINKTKDVKGVEKVLKSHTKKSLLSLCNYFQIETKSSDTKNILYEKIACHFGKEVQTETNEFEQIQHQLEKMEDVQIGKSFITNHETLKTKVNLIKLARTLNVYVNPKQKKEEIQSRIVESIVGARLRGKGIRER